MARTTLDPHAYPHVPVRLGTHAGPRRLSIHVAVERVSPPDETAGTVWGDAPPPERVEVFLRALRAGVPKLAAGADATVARVIATTRRDDGAVAHFDIELALPPIACAQLAPLAGILRTSFLAGTIDASIEERGVAELVECAPQSLRPTFRNPPFTFRRAKARDRLAGAALVIEFESDMTDGDGKALERWVSAWFGLVEAGAFYVKPIGMPSYGYITEVVDPYPDIWTFHCEDVVVDDDTCAFLLERLADVHAAHPIKKASLG